MISLHTNISSLVTQQNLTTSTSKLNTAIERLTTGYKINHAGDNAANYSISKNMSVQLSACDVAADNISMGMDLLQTAQDTIAGMQDRGSRIHALITQARNGTYGADSLYAMTQEAQALVSEINRLYVNTEYNGIKLFEIKLPEWAQEIKNNAGKIDGKSLEESGLGTIDGKTLEECAAANNGFINKVSSDTPQVIVTDPAQLESAISTQGKIGIGNVETLAELAKIVNGTDGYTAKNCSGKTIILTEDIDLSDYQDGEGWIPIGTNSNRFKGTFNGNGHKVTGLYINRPNASYQGLFGCAQGTIKNVCAEDVNITGGSNTGSVVGGVTRIHNCYSTGNVTGCDTNTGGLAGNAYEAKYSYSSCLVSGNSTGAGGLCGYCNGGSFTNCYATGDVSGKDRTGGLCGYLYGGNLTNCYATGNVIGDDETGGLCGQTNISVIGCYATGNVTGNNYIGGLVGHSIDTVTDSYATGNVSGNDNTGGLCGYLNGGNLTNCYATGNIEGCQNTGGLIGYTTNTITNCYTTGNVEGNQNTGGLIGYSSNIVTNCYATGNVSGNNATADNVGGLIGHAKNNITNCFATGDVTNQGDYTGGLVGKLNKTSGSLTVDTVMALGDVSGENAKATLIGGVVNTTDESNYAEINIENASVFSGRDTIGGTYKFADSTYTSIEYDMSDWLNNTKELCSSTNFQVGIDSSINSQISVITNMKLNLSINTLTSDSAYNSITSFLNQLSQKATEIGAAQNRLDSALESTMVQMDNLTSSLSTIRDADIGKVSSDYIKQQILQQACATLMSTANQNPSIALQLI